MAATANTGDAFTELTGIDADYDTTRELKVYSIKLKPGAAGDYITIFENSVSGPECCYLISTDGEARVEYFGGNSFRFVIDFSECNLSANHKVIIMHV